MGEAVRALSYLLTTAAEEAAGDEGGDEGDEDARDALEEEFDGGCVPRADGVVQGFAVADVRAVRFRRGSRWRGGACWGGGRRRGGRRLFEEGLQGVRDGGGFAGAEDDLKLGAADVRAEDAGDGGEALAEVVRDIAFEFETQARHAVIRLADVFPAADRRADSAGDGLLFRFGLGGLRHGSAPFRRVGGRL